MFAADDISAEEWNITPSAATLRMRKFRKSPQYDPMPRKSGVKATLLELPICAIDGEGDTRDDGSHDYTLLAAVWPNGRYKIESESLTFEQCMDFLLDLPEHHTYVGYGLSYDTNMWLKSLPRKIIDLLLDRGQAIYRHYKIRWIERKFFSVRKGQRQTTVYDVLANWQVTFVKACKAWKVGTDAEIDLIARMKEQRGNFNSVDPDQIKNYCFMECELLMKLCRKLFDAIMQTPYRPNAVYGPGALASAAMRKHSVARCMAELPEPVDQLTHYAYFGGRFDCAMFGWFQDIWQYDIKSAYPDQIRNLPCLAHGEWKKVTQPHEIAKTGLYQVEWEFPDNVAWTPFPHRDSNGNVFYPYRGRGWYHGIEVSAAVEYASTVGGVIRIPVGWEYNQTCNHRPFDFVDSLFELRKKIESEGGYDQGVVIKLILNSLYGKLAQQVGGRNGKKPTFQCFYWAGAITAGTRAKLLRAIAEHPESVIGVATDSIVSLRARDLEIGSELGEWELKRLADYAQIGNGQYTGHTLDGESIERSRGLNRGTLDWGRVRKDYVKSRGCGFHDFYTKSRFITLREARNHLDRSQIECRWIGPPDPRAKRRLNFWPSRRWPDHYNRAGPTWTLTPLQPDDYGASYESQPFRIKSESQEVIDRRIQFHAYDWQDFS